MKRLVCVLGISVAMIFVHLNAEEQTDIACVMAPIVKNPPKFPNDLSVNYEGYAEVEFIVDAEGNVREAKILNSEWKRKHVSRNMRADPNVYNKAILRAVESWKYEVQPQSCRATTRIAMEYE
ncbi:MAG TPA: energy transducer TonB [Gammaproteobacteria bacterium]|nr:energy transducer TonB [Gammaproteobacteria bacterium]